MEQMKKIFVLVFVLIGATNLYSQSTQSANDTNLAYTSPEQNPQFKGDVNKWLTDHIKYPESAKNAHMQGAVYVYFVVEKDGSIDSARVLRGVCPSLNDEAIRVVSSMPKWKPGMNNGKPVRVRYMVPIHFID